jgi:hypothetical protein
VIPALAAHRPVIIERFLGCHREQISHARFRFGDESVCSTGTRELVGPAGSEIVVFPRVLRIDDAQPAFGIGSEHCDIGVAVGSQVELYRGSPEQNLLRRRI